MDGAALAEEAKKLGLDLTRTQLEAFTLFEKKLYETNATTNLTAVKPDECWRRHFLDSLAVSPLIPKNASVLDIGSGPGFPGACLAIARPDLMVTCLDSATKMVAFMRSLFSPAGSLPVLYEIIQARAEELAHTPAYREKFGFVTGRAVAPFEVQLEMSAPFVAVGGLFLPMRTPVEREAIRGSEFQKLGLQLTDLKSARVAPIGADRLFPVFSKVGRTPAEFPRKWNQMKV